MATLVLAACGGGGSSGSSSSSGAIKSTITTLVKSHDCSQLTPAARKSLTGESGVATCSHDLALRQKVKSLSFSSISTSGNTATAKVVTDGQHVTLRLVKQGDSWLVSSIST